MNTRRDVVLIALLVVVSVVALAQSWNRWLDPIIDTGRDLYIADQVAHGTKLYRDVRYQYPPLIPYLLGAATSVIGGSLASFTAIGIVQSIVLAALLWLAVRGVGGFVAALFFVALSLAGASTWGANFVFPYAYAATIGVVFLIGALAAFVRGRHVIAISLLVLASWCKIEYAAAAVLVIVVLAAARRLRVVEAVGYFAAMLVSFAGVAAFFHDAAWRENVFASSLTRGEVARHFFRNVSGFVDWPRNLAIAIASATATLLISWLLKTRPRIAIAAVIVAALVFNSDSFFRGWALLQVVALAVGLRDRTSPLIYFAAFSIATTLRVPLNVSPQWYGCALVVPVYALAAYVLFVELPARGVRTQWWLAIVAAICVRDLAEQHVRYGVKTFPIASARGVFFDYNSDRAAVLNELIRSVRGPTLVVMPEGVTLNYLTRTPTPLTYHMFTPPETADAVAESAVLAELRQRAPQQVVVLTRDVSEYGFRGFGIDYDRVLFGYLLSTYRPERTWSRPRFQALLFARQVP